ncbi:MAG: tRNA-uridine aminocarboxypropyltransferase [Planctomycetaceae bacterium]
MPRSVVRAGADRCPRCSLQPRWCICDMLPPVDTQLAVHVLIHRGEQRKPSSTGTLVARVVTGTTQHVYQRQSRFFPPLSLTASSLRADREVWILHPHGEPFPAAGDADARTAPQVVLLDGTWRQAGEMLHSVEGLGRCVRLPDQGREPGRFWLRDQPGPGQLSTAEALAGVLAAVGEHDAARRLRLHFELHVYAMLLARGRREMAERYLGHSPLLTEAAAALDQLHARWAGD